MLVASSEADIGCHLAMVRFHTASGDLAEARKLLDATKTLDPVNPEVWQAARDFAVLTGDDDLLEAARVELAALSENDPAVPFGIPRKAVA